MEFLAFMISVGFFGSILKVGKTLFLDVCEVSRQKSQLDTPCTRIGSVNGAFEATVDQVFDGDTVQCVIQGSKRSVRLYGMDAPETSHYGKKAQLFSAQARGYLFNRVCFQRVTLIIHGVDKYGRFIAQILIGPCDIGLEMVQKGLAEAYRPYLKSTNAYDYILAELTAKEYKLGMWALPEHEYISPTTYKRTSGENICQIK